MSFSINNFLIPISSEDRMISFRNIDGIIKHTIDPFGIIIPLVSNNLLKIRMKSGSDINLDFRNTTEAKMALDKLQPEINFIKSKVPNIIDKRIQNYVDNILVSSVIQVYPVDPSTTTSQTGVMMGIGASSSITLTRSDKLFIILSVDCDNNIDNRGVLVQLRHGTGTIPINGDALTGTLDSQKIFFQSNSSNRGIVSLNSIISGLSISIPVWIDISVASNGGAGTARVRNISVSIIEI